MGEVRKGRQTPTQSVVLPYSSTYGAEAIDIYNSTGRTAQEWQELLTIRFIWWIFISDKRHLNCVKLWWSQLQKRN